MAVKRIYQKQGSTHPADKIMKLISSKREKAPTVKGQMETIRRYRLRDEPTEVLIIGDEEKGKKNIAVFIGYIRIGYFRTLDEAKHAVLKAYW